MPVKFIYLIFSIIFLIASGGSIDKSKMLPYKNYQSVIEKTEEILRNLAEKPEILIVHHGFCFYYTFISGRHTLPYVPEWEFNPTNVYRLAYGIEDSEIHYFLTNRNVRVPVRMNYDYVLFREDTWDLFIKNTVHDEDMKNKNLSVMNPYKKRPLFLRKK